MLCHSEQHSITNFRTHLSLCFAIFNVGVFWRLVTINHVVHNPCTQFICHDQHKWCLTFIYESCCKWYSCMIYHMTCIWRHKHDLWHMSYSHPYVIYDVKIWIWISRPPQRPLPSICSAACDSSTLPWSWNNTSWVEKSTPEEPGVYFVIVINDAKWYLRCHKWVKVTTMTKLSRHYDAVWRHIIPGRTCRWKCLWRFYHER